MNADIRENDKSVLGKYGEGIAAEFLEGKGFEILARNFRCRAGEIDIIAKDGGILSFTEVKLRKNADFGNACEFVTSKKQQKIIRAAEYYLFNQQRELARMFECEPQPRFDIVEVYLPDGIGKKAYVRLIEDAFSV